MKGDLLERQCHALVGRLTLLLSTVRRKFDRVEILQLDGGKARATWYHHCGQDTARAGPGVSVHPYDRSDLGITR
jgi:hypothetical protein